MRYIYPLTNTVRACLTVRQARTGAYRLWQGPLCIYFYISASTFLPCYPRYLFSGFTFALTVLAFLLMQGVQRLRQLHWLPGV